MVVVDTIRSSGPASTSYGQVAVHRQLTASALCIRSQGAQRCLPYRGVAKDMLRRERRAALSTCRATDNTESETSSSSACSPTGLTPTARDVSSTDPDAAAAEELWEAFKRDARKALDADEVKVLDSLKAEDVVGDARDLMSKVAEAQLGPLLRSMGVEEDPLAFLKDLLRLAASLQLVSAGVMFYGTELWGGLDSGEAFRCVCGLAAGYLTRPFIKVELLLWPLYDWGLRKIAPGTVYEVSTSGEGYRAALSQLGVAVALCTLLPRLLWGWDNPTILQFVLPLSAGWALFDVTFCAALLTKLP